MINGHAFTNLTSVDLEKALLQGDITLVGLGLQTEGFRKAGVRAFGIGKDLILDLHQFKYDVGVERGQPWMERLYHQRWTEEDIIGLTDRWCEEIIEEVTNRVAQF